MLCVSISGAAVSVNNTTPANTENEELKINLPTESPEVNAQVLKNINKDVEKYMNFGEYITGEPPKNTIEEFKFPWHNGQLGPSDWVEWVIHVNFNDNHFFEEIEINPINFKDRFLEHPWHYEAMSFDVDENGEDDLKIFYSIFNSQLTNLEEGIDTGSIRTCLIVDTAKILDRDAKLEVWSEIKLNYGLIKTSRNLDRSVFFDGRLGNILNRLLEIILVKFENIGFTPFINFWKKIQNRLQGDSEEEPIYEPLAQDDDWLALGIGASSPGGDKIPIRFTKMLNVAKENIFAPVVLEQQLSQVQSREPLSLLFGFQAGHAQASATFDVAFNITFDPAIDIRTQFIPRDGYIYYYYDTGSGYSQETSVTFSTNGFGIDDVKLSLIFDNTLPLETSKMWMSFELDPLGFKYKAKEKCTVGVLLSSPVFSAKLKLGGIPDEVDCHFDADLSFQYQQGELLNVEGNAGIELKMSSDMDDIILYYPELSEAEPLVEFIKVSDIPYEQTLGAHAKLYIENETMTTIRGEGYIECDMSSNMGSTEVFYRKPDPTDPDKLFLKVPSIPSDQRIGVKGELYINLNEFNDTRNYIFGRAYRTASGNIPGIHAYLPGETEPIISITDIPADASAEAKLEWSKLKGYARADRQSAGAPDPIEVNVDIGTFNIYNYFEIRDGHILLDAHLAENGYFKFDTSNDMIADEFRVTDTSTGNQIQISADNVNANDIEARWVLDLSEQPLQVEELKFSGELSLLENFNIDATYQGKNLAFDMDWQIGQEGKFSLDFTQDEPIEIIIDDLFENSTIWDIGGGIIISEDFHFDVSWKWEQGMSYDDPGYFLINEDTNDPNFDLIFLNITYTPDGEDEPQYGIEVGATDIIVIVYLKWWKGESMIFPQVWWYSYIVGDFYLDLLWNGYWHEDVHLW